MVKSKRRKLRYDRLALCVLVLIALLCAVCFCISSCVSAIFKNDDDDKSTSNTASSSKLDESSQAEQSQIEHITLNTEYCFDYSDITFTSNIDKSAYESVLKQKSDVAMGNLILVNNDHPFVFTGREETEFTQLNLSSHDSYFVKDNTVLVNSDIIDPLNEMLDDIYGDIGKQINVISGYRSYEYQKQLYAQDLEETGLEYSTLVALPGSSEHHCGLALDFGIYKNGTYESYDGIGDESIINENCHNYGFILRYQSGKEDLTHIQYESWHFRYIGKAHAFAVNYYDMCFEEYINMLKSYEFGKRHLGIRTDSGDYEVYYIPANSTQTEVFVPKERKYEISGNNVDGFIVTVYL